MTELLEQAISKMVVLPPEKQDLIAAIIIEELEDELAWEHSFAASQNQLAKLAEKVRADIKAGRVREMDFDDL